MVLSRLNFMRFRVAAVEDAKVFAASIVRPEPTESEIRPSTVAEVIVERAEQTSQIDTVTLSKIVDSPEIAEALAAEGLVIDKEEVNRAIEQNKRRTELEAIVFPNAAGAFDSLSQPQDEVELTLVTPESFRDLKIEINSSFEELSSLVLELQRQIEEIEARLSAFNRRGSHRI